MELIITSLLDQDQYKFGMGNAVFRLFPDAWVEYQFINRGNTDLGVGFADRLREQIDALCELKFADDDIDFLRKKCPYLSSHYLEWLKGYQFDPFEVWTESDYDGRLFSLRINGPWRSAIYWEVPLMAIISELYFHGNYGSRSRAIERVESQDIEKARTMGAIAPYSDFGTRRRFSKANHERIAKIHKDHGGDNFQGTSNVLLAKKYDLRPIGTVAHEIIMFCGAAYGYRYANSRVLKDWHHVYGGNLGIALSDTYTSDVFLRDFTKQFADVYDGVRQDSGDPLVFADKMIAHYELLGIDPRTKKIVFSDGLDVDKAQEIHNHCAGRIQDVYGIGTNFTNDVGVKPLNIVIKMVNVDADGDESWKDAVKLSDVEGKHTGSPDEIERCKRQLGLE